MVYTITFNPALDYILRTNEFKEGKVNRSFEEKLLPGGKGINVSQVLSELGVENTALGFVGGFTGDKIISLLEEKRIKCDFVKIKGESRINVKLKDKKETEINAKGPEITVQDVEKLFVKLKKLQKGDWLVLAGSVPESVSKDIYAEIAEKLESVKLVVDAEKELLKSVLPFKPFLVKPNHIELSDMFGVEIKTKKDAQIYARELVDMGALNVFVSMGEKGGVFVNKECVFLLDAPKGKLINSTGAGDSTVAGFIAEYIASENFEKAFKTGICAGSASAFSECLAKKEEITKLLTI